MSESSENTSLPNEPGTSNAMEGADALGTPSAEEVAGTPDALNTLGVPNELSAPDAPSKPDSTSASNTQDNSYAQNAPYTPDAPCEPPEPSEPTAASQQNAGFTPAPPTSAWTYLQAAWRDVMAPDGSGATLLLVALMGCIPIVDFFTVGYAATWGRDLSFGRQDPLPRKLFTSENFAMGLRVFVVQIPYVIVLLVASLLITLIIPLFGAIIALVVSFVFAAFVNLCYMRMAVIGHMSAAFHVKVIGHAMNRCQGLYAGVFVPGIAASLMSLFVAAVLALAMEPSLLTDFAFTDSMTAPAIALIQVALGEATAYSIVASLVDAALTTFATVVSMRAIGYWVAFAAPEWGLEGRAASAVPRF